MFHLAATAAVGSQGPLLPGNLCHADGRLLTKAVRENVSAVGTLALSWLYLLEQLTCIEPSLVTSAAPLHW